MARFGSGGGNAAAAGAAGAADTAGAAAETNGATEALIGKGGAVMPVLLPCCPSIGPDDSPATVMCSVKTQSLAACKAHFCHTRKESIVRQSVKSSVSGTCWGWNVGELAHPICDCFGKEVVGQFHVEPYWQRRHLLHHSLRNQIHDVAMGIYD